jgi:hypothetical protein
MPTKIKNNKIKTFKITKKLLNLALSLIPRINKKCNRNNY